MLFTLKKFCCSCFLFFTIQLLSKPVSNNLHSHRTRRKKGSPDERSTIVLVDDNRGSLLSGNTVLAGTYNVFTAHSGEQLLNMLKTHTPDLILLDIEMPDMDGFEVIKILKSQKATKSIPVIFLTGTTDEQQEITGLSLGAVDYITKPFSPPLLLKRIETHLLIDSQKRELAAQRRKLINNNKNLQRTVVEKAEMVIELQEAIVSVFAELIECRDDTTGGHVGRMQNYLHVFFVALLDNELYKDEVASWNIALILQSAHLHDVGKIGIKDHVLLKPGKLTAEEFEIIKTHVEFGETVIDKIKEKTTEKEFLEQAKTMISSHHEKWDGSGYPRGLKGTEIPLQGRMMAIVDVYDALTSDRPYKKAYSHEEALKIISDGSGTHFEPELVAVFMSISDRMGELTLPR